MKPVRRGVCIGLAAVLLLCAWPASREAGRRPLVPDNGGAFETLVIQYTPEARSIVGDVYRDFLPQLSSATTVQVLVPNRQSFDELKALVGPTDCALEPVVADHAMTCWSRDRWLALEDGEETLLLAAREEEGGAVWSARFGDRRVAFDLAAVLPARAQRSHLLFDGGDFVCDEKTVFVTPRVMERNVGITVASKKDLAKALQKRFRQRVVLLDEAPPYHAGMYLMAIGNNTVVVGDPRLAPEQSVPFPVDLSEGCKARFEAVAQRCRDEGYRVERMPVLPGRDGRTWLTPLNVVLETNGRLRTVYMPTYKASESLNRLARARWQALGFEVKGVDCSATYRYFGSLRCVVSVLKRKYCTFVQQQ